MLSKIKQWWKWFLAPQQELTYTTDIDANKKWRDALERARIKAEGERK